MVWVCVCGLLASRLNAVPHHMLRVCCVNDSSTAIKLIRAMEKHEFGDVGHATSSHWLDHAPQERGYIPDDFDPGKKDFGLVYLLGGTDSENATDARARLLGVNGQDGELKANNYREVKWCAYLAGLRYDSETGHIKVQKNLQEVTLFPAFLQGRLVLYGWCYPIRLQPQQHTRQLTLCSHSLQGTRTPGGH